MGSHALEAHLECVFSFFPVGVGVESSAKGGIRGESVEIDVVGHPFLHHAGRNCSGLPIRLAAGAMGAGWPDDSIAGR